MSGDRTVKAILKADVSGLVAGYRVASKATKDLAADAKKSASEHSAAWTSTGQGMMVAGGVMAAGVTLAVKSFADFDAAMSQVKVGTNTTGAALGALRAAAIDAGAKTQYSATEAADAITAMGKAGVFTKDILSGGLNGALTLAAAGQLDVAQASEIAATTMNQFSLAGKDLPHIADLLAAGAGKAMGSVAELSGALKYAGVVAAGAGWSIEETIGVLAEFAQAGIVGEQAGTSLRGVIMSLQGPSEIATKTMEDLGLSVYDANGHFLKAAPLAGALQKALEGKSEAERDAAMATIFGNTQMTAARVLLKGGAEAVDAWTKSSNDAAYAMRAAAELTNNWKGDVERLGGSLSSVLIQSGSGANGMLRTMTQTLQGAVDLYGSAPVPVQQAATALGAVSAMALLAGGGLTLLLPKVAAGNAALANMGRTGALMSKGISGVGSTLMGPVGIALAVGVIGLGYYAKQAQETAARVDELATSLDAQTGALTENTTATVNKKLSDDGSLASARAMGVAAGDLTAAYLGNTDAAKRVDDALKAYGTTLAGNADISSQMDAMDKLKATYHSGNAEVDAAVAKTKLLAEANAAAIDPTTGLTGAQRDAAAAAKELTLSDADLKAAADETKAAHDALTASITGYGSAMMTARGDARSYEAAIDAASAALKESGETYDKTTGQFKIGTDVQRASEAALDGIAKAALKVAESNLTAAEANGTLAATSRTVTADVGKARDAFIKQAHAMGAPIPVAKKMADQAGLTAGRVKKITDELEILGLQSPNPKITVAGAAAAKTAIASVEQYLSRLRDKTITIHEVRTTIDRQNSGRGVTRADGGPITGIGGPREDNIPLWGSVGEFMVNAESYAKHGSLVRAINADKFADGGLLGGQHLAAGGVVSSALSLSAKYGRSINADLIRGMLGGADVIESEAARKIGDGFDKVTTVIKAMVSSREELAKKTTAASAKITAAEAALAKAAATKGKTHGERVKVAREALALARKEQVAVAADVAAAAANAKVAHLLTGQATASELQLKVLADSRDALLDRTKTATEQLQALVKESDDFAASVASKQAAGVTIASLFFDGDTVMGLANVEHGIAAATLSAEEFSATIAALKAAGLDKSLLEQIIGEGAGKGGQIGAAILDGGTDAVARLNALQGDLTTASADLGKQAAADLYGAGVSAAQGLVAGLESKQKAIEAQMLKIALSMQTAIKKALGIHSASTVMRQLFGFAGEGAALGLADKVGLVAGKANRLAVAAVPSFRATGAGYSPAGVTSLAGQPVQVVVKVANPWTGEYHEQKMAGVVDKHLQVVLEGAF